jgi:hypothetical protein
LGRKLLLELLEIFGDIVERGSERNGVRLTGPFLAENDGVAGVRVDGGREVPPEMTRELVVLEIDADDPLLATRSGAGLCIMTRRYGVVTAASGSQSATEAPTSCSAARGRNDFIS